jgi:hypothetical protein
MLSEKEYNTILEQVKEPSSNISTNTMKTLQRKLKEHKYSTQFAPFEPLPHIPDFINRTTTEQTLHQIIQAATMSSEFTIDTESFNVFRQTNKPALIQLQIFLPHNSSFVLLVEVHHLPKNDHICFQLIQQLFRIIFVPEKTIYIFGPKQELDPFTEFELFSQDQIDNAHIIDLQKNSRSTGINDTLIDLNGQRHQLLLTIAYARHVLARNLRTHGHYKIVWHTYFMNTYQKHYQMKIFKLGWILNYLNSIIMNNNTEIVYRHTQKTTAYRYNV